MGYIILKNTSLRLLRLGCSGKLLIRNQLDRLETGKTVPFRQDGNMAIFSTGGIYEEEDIACAARGKL